MYMYVLWYSPLTCQWGVWWPVEECSQDTHTSTWTLHHKCWQNSASALHPTYKYVLHNKDWKLEYAHRLEISLWQDLQCRDIDESMYICTCVWVVIAKQRPVSSPLCSGWAWPPRPWHGHQWCRWSWSSGGHLWTDLPASEWWGCWAESPRGEVMLIYIVKPICVVYNKTLLSVFSGCTSVRYHSDTCFL